MAYITVGNSYSKLHDLTPAEEKKVKTALSYTIGGSSAYFSGYGVRKKSLLSRGEFPTGLMGRVALALGYLPYNKSPVRPTVWGPQLTLNKSITPYAWQLEVANMLPRCHQGTIAACTGSGKSLLIAIIASRIGLKTLVVVPTVEIRKQVSESLINALGRNHNCTVRNIDSTDLPKLKDFDVLIIDEAHHSASKTYQKLNRTAWQGIYYRYFLTATPFRNDSEEQILFEAIAGGVVYELTYKKALQQGLVVPIEAYYVDLPKKNVEGYTYQEVYKELVVDNLVRNAMTFSLLFSLYEDKKSALCLVKEVRHGKNIDWPAFVTGEDEDSRGFIANFNKRELYCIVGTTGILGEGVDTKPCEYVIIAGLGKSKSQFMQQIGRAVRLYPGKESAKVIIFKDRSHKFTLRHFNAQKKILLEEYGVSVRKLE